MIKDQIVAVKNQFNEGVAQHVAVGNLVEETLWI